MSKFFTKTKNFKEEYCTSVVKIGEVIPIENSDFLATTLVNGVQIVVRKDQVKEGDVLFYVANECELNSKFLSANNLYDSSNFEMNSNVSEVIKIKEEIKSLMDSDADEQTLDSLRNRLKGMCGYFNQYGRVRTIKLKGKQSFGYLFSLDELTKGYPEVKDINVEDYIGTDFDSVTSDTEDDVFVKAYVPRRKVSEHAHGLDRTGKRQKKIEKFDRVKDSNFAYHYDTSMLAKNMHKFSPEDVITITKKAHGTSHIAGKLIVRQPKKIAFYKRLVNIMCKMFRRDKAFIDYDLVYGPVYSSRSVIKNQYINKDVTLGYYSYDLWTEYGDFIYPYLDEGMTVYSEILGYTATGSPIQKGYDYGCEFGKSYMMPYRITTCDDGVKTEWNVTDVITWTNNLISEHPELADRLKPMTLFYHGTLAKLYPELDITEHWHENVLEKLKKEKKFHMEMNEPLCKNKVPAEGVVIRKDDDSEAEAWKLKCDKFYAKEAEAVDNGDVDIEMDVTYTEQES